MRILVDTSVWSLALRKDGPAEHPAVERLLGSIQDDDEILFLGAIIQEVLQGFRSEATVRKLLRRLEPFPMIVLRREDHVAAARLRRDLASRGVTAATVDCMIASAAVRYGCLLLAADDDFRHIARHSRLKLA